MKVDLATRLREGVGLRGLLRRVFRALAYRIWATAQDASIDHLKRNLGSCGRNVRIYYPVAIEAPGAVHVGDDVSIAAFVHIWGAGGVTIGNRVMIAAHSAITSLTHDYEASVMSQTLVAKSVSIEDDVWIGSNAVVLPGVTIGRGAVVGAGAVVINDVEPCTIVVGAPARPVGTR
jgi:maltose O-acetyltransferase